MEASDGESSSNAGRLPDYNVIPPYSKPEAEALYVRLCNKETFREGLKVLLTWLQDEQCNERNSEQIYDLIQLCWNHMEKLQAKQKEYLKEAQKAQESLGNKSCCIKLQLNEMEELFEVIEKEKIKDKFTQNQIEKIHEIRRDILDLKQNIFKGSVGIVDEEVESSCLKNVAHKVLTKADSSTYGLNTVNQKSEDPEARCKECQKEILKLKSELENRKIQEKNNSISVGDKQQNNSDVASQSQDQVYQNEMHLVSIVSVYLYGNPDGVNIDCIYSDLNRCIPFTCARKIEEVMRKYPHIFKESSPIDSTQETKWTCISIIQKTLSEFLNK